MRLSQYSLPLIDLTQMLKPGTGLCFSLAYSLIVPYLQHVMRFSEAAQEVQVHRAHDKPKFIDEGFVRGRRRLASQGIDLVPAAPPAKKKASVERLPHAPVPISDIYRLPPFPQIAVS